MKNEETVVKVEIFNEVFEVFIHWDVMKKKYVMDTIYVDDHNLTDLIKTHFRDLIFSIADKSVNTGKG